MIRAPSIGYLRSGCALPPIPYAGHNHVHCEHTTPSNAKWHNYRRSRSPKRSFLVTFNAHDVISLKKTFRYLTLDNIKAGDRLIFNISASKPGDIIIEIQGNTTLTQKIKVDRNDVPAIPALVDRHLDRMVNLQLQLMGIDPNTPGLDRDAIKEHAREDAEKTVRSMLLLQAIAKKESVEVQEADVEKRLAEIASARGQNVAGLAHEHILVGEVIHEGEVFPGELGGVRPVWVEGRNVEEDDVVQDLPDLILIRGCQAV